MIGLGRAFHNVFSCFLMSFLLTQDDKSTLDEALAFIDAYDPKNAQTTDDSSEDVSSLDDLVADLLDVPKTQDQVKPKSRKRRVRSAATSSTALQRRKRAELATLRDQVEELQSTLGQLQRTKALGGHLTVRSATNNGAASRSPWNELAMQQYQKRVDAEKSNRHLKAILANQDKVRKSICAVLRKRSALYGIDFVMQTEAPSCGSASLIFNHLDPLMTCLEDSVERQLANAGSVFEMLKGSVALSNTMQTQYKESRTATSLEFETTTPMPCSLKRACKILWDDFRLTRVAGDKAGSLQKKIVFTMQGSKGTIHTEKLHYVRKSESDNHMLICWADIMALPTTRALHYRTEGWILLTRSDADPLNACVARSLLKLDMDTDGAGCRIRPEDMVYARDVVLGAMAAKLRKFWQCVQNMLLDASTA